MIWQLVINSVIAGAVYALVGIGFALVYNVSRFFHFTHGVIFTFGAYSAFFFAKKMGVPIYFSIPIAVVVTTLVGSSLHLLVFDPIRRRNNAPLILLLSSLGVYIILQNLISMSFGDDIKTLRSGVIEEGAIFFGARITLAQTSIMLTSSILIVAVMFFLSRTRFGMAMQVVSSNEQLAEVCGIKIGEVLLGTFGLGSALGVIAGILVSLDVDMTPTMGLPALMMGVVAVIIGGIRSIKGIFLGALLLGFAQHLGTWMISSQWQDAIAFFILIVFLIFKPEGFLGKKIKISSV